MSCQCYQIGGPFIAEDPDCPIHGRDGREREDRFEAIEEDSRKLRESVRMLVAKWRLEASTSEELHGGLYLAANELETFLAENKEIQP